MIGLSIILACIHSSFGEGEAVTKALSAVAEYNARLNQQMGAERAIASGGVKDFSDVVLGMIESLQDIEDKGDEMVQKIDVQEDHLETLSKEIEAKETYVAAIDQKIKANEARHNKMVEELRRMEEDRLEKEEATKANKRKIKAQEMRLQRLLKDITTKVNYVQVIDSKVEEMENMTRVAAKDLLAVQQKRDGLGKEVKELSSSRRELVRDVKNFTLLVEGRRQMKRDESRQFELEVKLYNQTIEQMEGALAAYRSKISEANSTLSNLELAVRENSPVEIEPSQSHLWPAFLVSLAGNFVMGGILLGTFELPLSSQEDDQLPFYDSTEGVEVQIGSEVDPLLELARVKEEREKVFGKKSNFLRRRGLDPYAGI